MNRLQEFLQLQRTWESVDTSRLPAETAIKVVKLQHAIRCALTLDDYPADKPIDEDNLIAYLKSKCVADKKSGVLTFKPDVDKALRQASGAELPSKKKGHVVSIER